jgi:hypothetical protein
MVDRDPVRMTNGVQVKDCALQTWAEPGALRTTGPQRGATAENRFKPVIASEKKLLTADFSP